MTSLALAALLLRMEARSLERPQSLGAAASHDGCTVRPQNLQTLAERPKAMEASQTAHFMEAITALPPFTFGVCRFVCFWNLQERNAVQVIVLIFDHCIR